MYKFIKSTYYTTLTASLFLVNAYGIFDKKWEDHILLCQNATVLFMLLNRKPSLRRFILVISESLNSVQILWQDFQTLTSNFIRGRILKLITSMLALFGLVFKALTRYIDFALTKYKVGLL